MKDCQVLNKELAWRS